MQQFTPPTLDGGFDDLGYHHASNAAADTAMPEIALWCAVIQQAFVDVGFIVPKNASADRAHGPDYRAALRFLTRGKTDFLMVWSLAGVNPEVVRAGAMRLEDAR